MSPDTLILTPLYDTSLVLIQEDDPLELVSEHANCPIVLRSSPELELLLAPILQGPPGHDGASGDGSIQFPFAWGDASPRTVTVAHAGKLVYGVQLHVSQAFDGDGAALEVGDAGQPDRLMAAGQSDPTKVGSYTVAPAHRYGADTPVLLTITPGDGATAGAGLLTLFIEQ